MKNIIYLILIAVCFNFNNCSAQNTPYHRLDPNADKFVGTWKWGDTHNGLILIMKKENNVNVLKNDSDMLDIILGFHKIYKNGQITEDTSIFSNTNFIDNKRSFIATTETGTNINDPNQLRLFMTHKKKNIIVLVTYLDASHIKITEVKNVEGARIILPGKNPTDWSIDIPNNIILTKE